MGTYGLWQEKIEIAGSVFHADLIDPYFTKRAECSKIYAINGLPARYEDDLVRSSQVCDVPHTWRVQECTSVDEVTPEILQRGRDALSKDFRELNAHIVTYVGEPAGQAGELQFLAAGAIRDKLSRDYQDEFFPVVSRAIVAPKFRGKGLGSLIVQHRMEAALHYFGVTPKAIHFGTESKKVLQSIKRVEDAHGLTFVYIGDEQYTASDGTHTVHDFLSFLPWYQKSLLAACDSLQGVSDPVKLSQFKDDLQLFMQKGVDGVSGASVEASFEAIVNTLAASGNLSADTIKARDALQEVFFVKKKIGASDPIPL